MTEEFRIKKNRFSIETETPHLYMHDTEMLTQKAKITLSMLERWGMVAGYPDGEDSVGRAKLGLQPIESLVERAINTVETAFQKFREK